MTSGTEPNPYPFVPFFALYDIPQELAESMDSEEGMLRRLLKISAMIKETHKSDPNDHPSP